MMKPIDGDAVLKVLAPQVLVNKGIRFAGLRSGRTIELARLLLIRVLEETPVLKNVVLLPCNIGDTVYEAIFTTDGKGSHICERVCCGIHIADKVSKWRYDVPVRYLVFRNEGCHSIRIRMDELGKTLFLTRAEAEIALRKGKKENAE